jgi:hypothetical protein
MKSVYSNNYVTSSSSADSVSLVVGHVSGHGYFLLPYRPITSRRNHNFERKTVLIMKTSVVIVAGLVASAHGFAPSTQGRVMGTQLSESLFDKVFGMDLFAPVKDQNDYGARGKKNVS